ncbi:hypothetical protein B0H19DRAFT_1351275 [Mycena capillaripes]|nr:hypothetical protein B0H19DRAFT_1351275 [Mycena capillaripes]
MGIQSPSYPSADLGHDGFKSECGTTFWDQRDSATRKFASDTQREGTQWMRVQDENAHPSPKKRQALVLGHVVASKTKPAAMGCGEGDGARCPRRRESFLGRPLERRGHGGRGYTAVTMRLRQAAEGRRGCARERRPYAVRAQGMWMDEISWEDGSRHGRDRGATIKRAQRESGNEGKGRTYLFYSKDSPRAIWSTNFLAAGRPVDTWQQKGECRRWVWMDPDEMRSVLIRGRRCRLVREERRRGNLGRRYRCGGRVLDNAGFGGGCAMVVGYFGIVANGILHLDQVKATGQHREQWYGAEVAVAPGKNSPQGQRFFGMWGGRGYEGGPRSNYPQLAEMRSGRNRRECRNYSRMLGVLLKPTCNMPKLSRTQPHRCLGLKSKLEPTIEKTMPVHIEQGEHGSNPAFKTAAAAHA